MSRLTVFFLLLLAALCLASCGGSGSIFSSTAPPADVAVTMSVQDTPPAGVAVLSFQIQITSASLLPSDTLKPPVTLLMKSTDVELTRLQSEPGLLGSLNVPAGAYSGVTVQFANPRMVIFNNSSVAVPIPGGSCAVKEACKVTPNLNSSSVTVSSPTAPFPLTLTSNSPVGFLLHFDVNSSVQTDLSVTPTIDLKKITPNGGVIHQQHLVGVITDVSAPPYFTLQPGIGGPIPVANATSPTALPPAIQIKTDNNTKYIFVDDLRPAPLCAANTFSCLAKGQTVKMIVNVMSDGTLLATVVSLYEQQNESALEGTVLKVDAAHNVFAMALMGGQWANGVAPSANAAVGVVVTVTVTPSTVYEIDKDGFTIPAGLVFDGITDMIPGQTVEVQALPTAVGASTTANPLPLTTLRVRLDETVMTAKVASIDTDVTPPTAFTLNLVPPVFSPATSIKVQTITGQTQFHNVAGVSGLTAGDIVSVGGLLFNTGTTPTIAAEKVLKRILCSATAAGSSTIVPCVM